MSDLIRTLVHAAEVATGRLGWPPDLFWAATPAELGTALRGLVVGQDLAATGKLLERLKKEFPDERPL